LRRCRGDDYDALEAGMTTGLSERAPMIAVEFRYRTRLVFWAVGLGLASMAVLASAAELVTARPGEVGLSAERLARLDAAMQAEVDAGRKTGIVTLIARRGRVAHLKAFGMAERESNTAMRADSLFRLYSMTKPVTSVALLMLYEEGKFQLSDPLEKYIPEFKDVQVFVGMDGERMRTEAPRRKPTIHDVFRHTAGFSYGFGATPIDRAYAEKGVDFVTTTSLKQLVTENLPKVPLLYHPGDQWVYSVAHDVQAYLVEYFSGMPFDEFCRTRIFAPLGMTDATFGVPKSYASRYTANYAPDPANPAAGLVRVETREGVPPAGAPDGGPLGAGYARYTNIPFGGLSMSSTAMDYALFGQMLVNGGELNGRRLLGAKTVELMTMNNLPPSIPAINLGPPGTGSGALGYGLGVSVTLDTAQAGNLGSKGTFGWAGAASTWAILDPEEDLVLILMAQYMVADFDFAGRFQTLAYQAIVD
jgi:CubicO group peptidase (beta-lactamase class C family)